MSDRFGTRRRIALIVAVAVGVAIIGTLLVVLVRGGEAKPPSCTGAAALNLDCQKRRFATILGQSGPETAFTELKRSYRREGFVRNGCHPIVHAMGNAAADRYGSVAEAYGRGDSFCSAGYYHGVVERIIQDGGPRKMLSRADRLCADLGGRARHSIYHRNCAHGLGHGFMAVRNYELRDSLGTCDSLRDPWERRSCYGGVFMENVMTLGRNRGPSRYLRPEEPLYPCRALERKYREMCFQKQTGYALFISDDDFGAVFVLCSKIERAFRAACHQGLGTNIAVHYLKRIFRGADRTGLTAATCAIARDRDARQNCIKGAVRAVINYYHGVLQAKRICEAVKPALQSGCLDVVADKKTWPE